MEPKTYRTTLWYLLLLLVGCIVIYALYTRMSEREKLYMQNMLSDVALEFRAARQSYDMLSQHVFDNDINTQAVTSIMAEAARSKDPQRLRQLHQQLLGLA